MRCTLNEDKTNLDLNNTIYEYTAVPLFKLEFEYIYKIDTKNNYDIQWQITFWMLLF